MAIGRKLLNVLLGAAGGYVAGSKEDTPEVGAASGLLSGYETGRTLSNRVRIPKRVFGLDEDGLLEFDTPKEAVEALKSTRRKRQFVGVQDGKAVMVDDAGGFSLENLPAEGKIKPRTSGNDRNYYFIDPTTRKLFDADMNAILAPPEGAIPKILPPTPEGSAASKAAAEKAVRSEKLKEMNKAVDFFEQKINEIPSGKGIYGRMVGTKKYAEGVLQTDPKAAAYISSLSGLRSQIARGLGEVGNLAEQEQKYAINLLPKITDNTETRIQKLNNFKDYIRIKLNADSIPEGRLGNEENESGYIVGEEYEMKDGSMATYLGNGEFE